MVVVVVVVVVVVISRLKVKQSEIVFNLIRKKLVWCTTLKTRGFRVFKYIYYEIRTKVI